MLSGLGQDSCPSTRRRSTVRFSAPLLTLAGTVAGTAAAVVAYQATAAAGPATKPASVETQEPAPAASTSWKPCEHGWKVQGTACVRVKEKVVVVHDLPAPAAAPATTAGVRSSSHSSTHETEHADDSSQEVEHASDDGGQDTEGPDSEDVGSDD
jgi:hypothetical protein